MKNRVNTGRQLELDVAKVFAILYMVVIHVYEEMSTVNYYVKMPDNLLRGILEFVGGPLAAPVFMFAMGVGMVYSRKRSPGAFAIRGLKMLAVAYVLNIVRYTIPYLVSLLAGEESGGYWSLADTIGLVDILQFAGMSYLLVALLKKCRVNNYGIVAIALLLQVTGMLLHDSFHDCPKVAQYALGLVFHTNPYVVFPLSLWFVFPASGLLFGDYLQTVNDKRKMYNRMSLISLAGFVAISASMKLAGRNMLEIFALAYDVFYSPDLLATLWMLSIIGLQMSVCYRISLNLKGGLRDGTIFVSRQLKTIYLVQWVIIAYSVLAIEMSGLPRLPLWAVVPGGIAIAALSIFVSRFVKIEF